MHRPEKPAKSTKFYPVKGCSSAHVDSIGCLPPFPLCASLQGTVKYCRRKTQCVDAKTQIIYKNLAMCRQ